MCAGLSWRLSFLWCLQYSQKEDKYEEEIKVLTDKLKEVRTSLSSFSPGEASIVSLFCSVHLNILLVRNYSWFRAMFLFAAGRDPCRVRWEVSRQAWEDHWWPWRYDFHSLILSYSVISAPGELSFICVIVKYSGRKLLSLQVIKLSAFYFSVIMLFLKPSAPLAFFQLPYQFSHTIKHYFFSLSRSTHRLHIVL